METITFITRSGREVITPTQICPRCQSSRMSVCSTYCQECERQVDLFVMGDLRSVEETE